MNVKQINGRFCVTERGIYVKEMKLACGHVITLISHNNLSEPQVFTEVMRKLQQCPECAKEKVR